jgi:AbiJ N-terminal domain 4
VSFSERYGYKKVRTLVQRESMDEELRTGLWNMLDLWFWDDLRAFNTYESGTSLARKIWAGYFKAPIDQIPRYWEDAILVIRKYFFECYWNEAYDFVEFMASVDAARKERFVSSCNTVMERDLSAYRFVGGRITEITAKSEIDEIESAFVSARSAGGAATHLEASLAPRHLGPRSRR